MTFERVHAADFGVSADNLDNTSCLQMAADTAVSCGKQLVIPDGLIKTDTIHLLGPVSIVGQGKGVTVLEHIGSGAAVFYARGAIVPDVALVSSGAEPRATSFTVVCADGISAGDTIILHDSFSYTSTDSGYKSGEMLKVKSVDGTTINIFGAVTGSWASAGGEYSAANSARVSKVLPLVGVSTSEMSLRGNPALGNGGLRFDFCDQVSVSNVAVSDFGGYGIGFNSTRDATVVGSNIRDLTDDVPAGLAGYGIYTRGACRNISVVGGSVSRVRHAFTTMGSGYGMPHNVSISGMNISETSAAALDTHAAGSGITFSSNNVTDCFQGFTSRARKVVCQGNVFSGTYGAHVITLAEENLRDYMIRGNTIWGSPGGSSAITARNPVAGLNIIDNYISDAGADAIMLNPGCTNVLITRNTSRNVGRNMSGRYHVKAGNSAGIVPGVSGGWTIVDNLFIQGLGSAARAIDLSSDGVTGAVIVDNKITGSYTQNNLDALILATGSLVYNNPWCSQAPPAVTGSRSGVPAVASALSVLHKRGIITDNTTP